MLLLTNFFLHFYWIYFFYGRRGSYVILRGGFACHVSSVLFCPFCGHVIFVLTSVISGL